MARMTKRRNNKNQHNRKIDQTQYHDNKDSFDSHTHNRHSEIINIIKQHRVLFTYTIIVIILAYSIDLLLGKL